MCEKQSGRPDIQQGQSDAVTGNDRVVFSTLQG